MSHKMHSGEMTPREALAAARDLGREVDDCGGLDTSYDTGREIVREYVEQLDAGDEVHVRARRVLLETGHRQPGHRGDRGDTQAVGRTLAAMARGVTPDDYLPYVQVSKWSDVSNGGATTWTIKVVDDV